MDGSSSCATAAAACAHVGAMLLCGESRAALHPAAAAAATRLGCREHAPDHRAATESRPLGRPASVREPQRSKRHQFARSRMCAWPAILRPTLPHVILTRTPCNPRAGHPPSADHVPREPEEAKEGGEEEGYEAEGFALPAPVGAADTWGEAAAPAPEAAAGYTADAAGFEAAGGCGTWGREGLPHVGAWGRENVRHVGAWGARRGAARGA